MRVNEVISERSAFQFSMEIYTGTTKITLFDSLCSWNERSSSLQPIARLSSLHKSLPLHQYHTFWTFLKILLYVYLEWSSFKSRQETSLQPSICFVTQFKVYTVLLHGVCSKLTVLGVPCSQAVHALIMCKHAMRHWRNMNVCTILLLRTLFIAQLLAFIVHATQDEMMPIKINLF